MRILHVVRALDMGGMERLVVELAAHQSCQMGIAEILCVEHLGRLADHARERGVKVSTLEKGAGTSVRCLHRMYRHVRQTRYDVVHTHNKTGLFYAVMPARAAGVPALVHTQHGCGASSFRGLPRWGKAALNRTDRIVGVSPQIRELYLSLGLADSSRVDVIANGVPCNGSRDRRGPIPHAPKLCFVGRLSPEKGLPSIIEAFRQLQTRGHAATLHIIGDGPEADHCRRCVDSANLSHSVTFYGMREDATQLMQQMDIFVLASTTEGLPIALLEAMAAGLPVVATNVGAIPLVVADQVTGRLVPPENVDALAAGIEPLLVDSTLRLRMGMAGQQRVREHFSIDSCARRYGELYGRIMRRKSE